MQAIHQLVADAALVAVAIVLAWTVALAITKRTPGRGYGRAQALMVGTIAVAAIAGAASFISGARPTDVLHLLYGAVAILLVPFARSFLRGVARRDTVVLLVAILALGGVMYRLFATG
ncbi:MAG: hypothetical protein ACYDAN_08775 [Candidatus Limnocylindrales bacterium]